MFTAKALCWQAFLAAVSEVLGYSATVQAVSSLPANRRSASGSNGGIVISVLLSGVDPSTAAAVTTEVTDSTEKLEQQVSQTLWNAPVTALPPTLGAGAGAFACDASFQLNTATQTCCPAGTVLPAANANLDRVMWTNSCAWQCVQPYILYAGACLLCSERNSLPATHSQALPANASWDNSGASPDCTLWNCNVGLLALADQTACLPYGVLQQGCARYSRCATCAGDNNCVWCPASGGCHPGRSDPKNKTGCRFSSDGSGSRLCDCEVAGCSLECTQEGCNQCLQDPLCGWCGGLGNCQLDLAALTATAATTIEAARSSLTCSNEWIPYASALLVSGGAGAICPSDTEELWIVALVSS